MIILPNFQVVKLESVGVDSLKEPPRRVNLETAIAIQLAIFVGANAKRAKGTDPFTSAKASSTSEIFGPSSGLTRRGSAHRLLAFRMVSPTISLSSS